MKNNKKSVKQTAKRPIKKRRIVILSAIALLILTFIAVSYLPIITTTSYTIKSNKVKENVRICLLTDLHASNYGREWNILLREIDKASPDLVLLVGDIFDEKRKIDTVETILTTLAEKYSCYYVTGNHEYYFPDAEQIKTTARACGVTVLSNDIVELTVNGQSITLCGVDDLFAYSTDETVSRPSLEKDIAALASKLPADSFSVLLSHRPQLTDIYEKYSFDLVLSGHNHGGQMRIPFTNIGLFNPRDGFFPDLCGGVYPLSDTTQMVVSRGLCRNIYPRTFNPPEIVVIDIINQ